MTQASALYPFSGATCRCPDVCPEHATDRLLSSRATSDRVPRAPAGWLPVARTDLELMEQAMLRVLQHHCGRCRTTFPRTQAQAVLRLIQVAMAGTK